MKNEEIIELLAGFEHDRWSRWQKYLFSKCIVNNDGSLTIPKELVKRWNRQISTNYNSLTEQEKDSDKKETIRIIKCIEDKIMTIDKDVIKDN